MALSVAALIGAPGRLPLARAAAIGLALLAVPLVWWTCLWALGHRAAAPAAQDIPPLLAVAAAVVVAPLVETLVLAALHWLAAQRLGAGPMTFTALTVAVAVAAHLPPSLVRTPVTAAIFAVFAWQYAGWFAAKGWRRAYPGVALAHGVYNAGALVLSPLWAALLKAA